MNTAPINVGSSDTPPMPGSDTVAGLPWRPQVLVVEDDLAIRHLLELVLSLHGFSALLAQDAAEAVAIQRGGARIDAAIIDVHLPGLDGPRILGLLRQTHPDLRCCFMSSSPHPYTAEQLIQLGGGDFIEKPFQLNPLTRALWALCLTPQPATRWE